MTLLLSVVKLFFIKSITTCRERGVSDSHHPKGFETVRKVFVGTLHEIYNQYGGMVNFGQIEMLMIRACNREGSDSLYEMQPEEIAEQMMEHIDLKPRIETLIFRLHYLRDNKTYPNLKDEILEETSRLLFPALRKSGITFNSKTDPLNELHHKFVFSMLVKGNEEILSTILINYKDLSPSRIHAVTLEKPLIEKGETCI